MMKRVALLAAAAIALNAAPAAALPGETMAQFQAWSGSNSALHGLKKVIEEMDGMPAFMATFRAGSVPATFYARTNDGKTIAFENVAIADAADSYDILKHPSIAQSLVSTVYGSDVAADLAGAKNLGAWTEHGQSQQTALYRGKLYGYEMSHSFVQLLPLAGIDAELKLLKTCATQECGD